MSHKKNACLFWAAGGLSFLPLLSCKGLIEPLIKASQWCSSSPGPFVSICTSLFSSSQDSAEKLYPAALHVGEVPLAPSPFLYEPGWNGGRVGPGGSIPGPWVSLLGVISSLCLSYFQKKTVDNLKSSNPTILQLWLKTSRFFSPLPCGCVLPFWWKFTPAWPTHVPLKKAKNVTVCMCPVQIC